MSTHEHRWEKCVCGEYLSEGAAPRAEGLDVERLAEWFHNKWESQGLACWHKNQHMRSWDCGRDAIEAAEYVSRPSDERVPPCICQFLCEPCDPQCKECSDDR